MNTEELIQQLDGLVTKKPRSYWSKYERNIIDETIKALKQGHCEDAVSRKKVVQWLETASDDSIEEAINSNLWFISSVNTTKKNVVEQEKIDKAIEEIKQLPITETAVRLVTEVLDKLIEARDKNVV